MSEIKVPQAGFSLCPHMVVPLCVRPDLHSHKNDSPVGRGPILVTSFNFITSLKPYLQMQPHSEMLRIRAEHKELRVGTAPWLQVFKGVVGRPPSTRVPTPTHWAPQPLPMATDRPVHPLSPKCSRAPPPPASCVAAGGPHQCCNHF